MESRWYKSFLFTFCAVALISSLSAQSSGNGRAPSRMDLLDQTYEIKINDRLVYQVMEEQSPSVVLSPDSEGNVKFPLLSTQINIGGFETPFSTGEYFAANVDGSKKVELTSGKGALKLDIYISGILLPQITYLFKD